MLYLISALACFGLAASQNYAPASTQEAWNNHFGAFGAQNTTRILWDYNEESVIRTFEAGANELVASGTFTGLDAIGGFFDDLWVTLSDPEGLNYQVEVVDGNGTIGQVFLVWTAPASDILQATDTFIFADDAVTIKYQNIVFTRNAQLAEVPASEGASRRLLSQEAYNPANVEEAWENHFAAFAAQDLDQIMLDYDDSSVLRIFNFDTDTMAQEAAFTSYTGVSEIRGFFADLFADIWDVQYVSTPQDAIEADDMVFLVWEAPELGVRWATDTFAFEGVTIRHQNIATAFTPIPEPADSSTGDDGGVDAAGVVHRASIGAVAGLALGYVFA